MSEADWYDWLSEHEEIRGGKVQVMGLSRDRSSFYGNSGSEDVSERDDSDFDELDDVDPAYLAAVRDLRMHETAASTLTRGLDHAKGASPSPPRLDRRQLSTPDELGGARSRNEGGKTAMHQTDSPAGSVRRHGAGAGAGYSVGLGGHREQEVGESPTGSRRRHGGGAGAGGGYTVGVVGPPMLQPARLTPAEQRSPHTWMVRKEMRDTEERILVRAEQVASARAREAEERVRERMERELAELRPFMESGGLLREELRRLRATNEDLRTSLLTMTMSLREELASTKVDC